MKVCYLADINSIHTKKWCEFFKAKGHDISVISLTDGHMKGINVYSLNLDLNKVQTRGVFYKLRYLFQIHRVKKLIREINPDILHAHYATSYGLLGVLSNHHPFIISVWGSDVFEFPNKGLISKNILKYNLRKSDIVLSTSKIMAMETKKYTNKHIEITPFGVDIDFFKPINRNHSSQNLVIGTVKSLEEKYGIEYLIKAFAILRKKYNNITLEIAGDGTQKIKLQELAQSLKVDKYIKFLGKISSDKVVEVFNKIDIAVFPSLQESFGVAAVEAQACGTPVIANDVGGLPEATKPNHSSILVSKENVEELSNAIEKLILDEKLRMTMGVNGRKFVENNYNIEKNFENVEEIYNKLYKNWRKK